MQISDESALVLFSGGQDSATCLAWALNRFGRVETIGFDYGQRHVVELQLRGAVRAGWRRWIPAGRRGWARTTCSRSPRSARCRRRR